LDTSSSHVLAVATVRLDGRSRERYSVALTGSPLRPAEPGDGAWRALAVAMADGRTIASLPPRDDPRLAPTAALVCRPARALADLAPEGPGPERDLSADQSHTSVVLGDDLLLKAYRRLQPGLNPDLEMTAFLSEDARFPAVPRLAGYAEVVARSGEPTTVAMLEEYVADGADAFESIAGMLVGWLTSPGDVSLEFATEIAADLGTLTAGLHAAVADGRGIPGMAPRDATRKEIRTWAQAAQQHLETALGLATGEAAAVLQDLAQRIAESISVIDALPTAPEVIRAHGDYHLGQVLIAQDGFRIVDFEGEPLETAEARRAHRPALRDVASMLRSLDHVARSAGRRAEAANGGPLQRAGLDPDAWIARARVRFLEAYRAGLRERRVWADIDPDLLHAFEVDKELYEFAYAATYLPSWSYAPIGGMRALFADGTAR
jgi:maltose alpha-D-glucosyltransferase/alpha-amylase